MASNVTLTIADARQADSGGASGSVDRNRVPAASCARGAVDAKIVDRRIRRFISKVPGGGGIQAAVSTRRRYRRDTAVERAGDTGSIAPLGRVCSNEGVYRGGREVAWCRVRRGGAEIASGVGDGHVGVLGFDPGGLEVAGVGEQGGTPVAERGVGYPRAAIGCYPLRRRSGDGFRWLRRGRVYPFLPPAP